MRVFDANFFRGEHFDLDVSVCGYERRSTYVAGASLSDPTQRLVIDYRSPGQGAYDANRAALEKMGATIVTEGAVIEAVVNACQADARIRVDVSSMRRDTMGQIVHALYRVAGDLDVQFVYAPAAYEASSRAIVENLALSAGPVTSDFSGALRPLSIPLGLIAGLGLERHRALGLTELLEPSQVWAFLALGDDSRFPDAVSEVNQPTVEDPQTVLLQYDVRSIAGTYAAVESLVYAASQAYRLVLAPSGPKMFTLACLLAAVPESPYQPAVWRVGGGSQASSIDLQAAGDVVAAEVKFSTSPRPQSLLSSSVPCEM